MKAKIIIVEDHEPIRNELKILLSKYGYEIIAIEHFDTVVEDCLRENADLILLDINLPLYDGYYVCRAIREKSEVPIIVVTSRDSEMDELMSINLGADDFITKPYNTQILSARISAMLKRTHKEKVNDFFKSFETMIVKEKEAFYEKLFIEVIDDLNLNPSANNTKKEYQIINPKIVLTVSIN